MPSDGTKIGKFCPAEAGEPAAGTENSKFCPTEAGRALAGTENGKFGPAVAERAAAVAESGKFGPGAVGDQGKQGLRNGRVMPAACLGGHRQGGPGAKGRLIVAGPPSKQPPGHEARHFSFAGCNGFPPSNQPCW
jgi:hypothetical protein